MISSPLQAMLNLCILVLARSFNFNTDSYIVSVSLLVKTVHAERVFHNAAPAIRVAKFKSQVGKFETRTLLLASRNLILDEKPPPYAGVWGVTPQEKV
jgi:hypothetical protein